MFFLMPSYPVQGEQPLSGILSRTSGEPAVLHARIFPASFNLRSHFPVAAAVTAAATAARACPRSLTCPARRDCCQMCAILSAKFAVICYPVTENVYSTTGVISVAKFGIGVVNNNKTIISDDSEFRIAAVKGTDTPASAPEISLKENTQKHFLQCPNQAFFVTLLQPEVTLPRYL